ncbi:MAG: ABC transporter permease [Treponema sp.]
MTRRRMYFKMVFSSLLRRRSRMVIALLAIAIGSTVLSGLLTIYYDIPRQMGTIFRSYGANILFIPEDDEVKITKEMAENIKGKIAKDKLIGFAPYIYRMTKVHELPYMLAATDLEAAKKNSPYWLVRGEWPKKKREVIIGQEISRATGISVGDSFVVNTPKGQGDEVVTEFIATGMVITGGVEEEFVFLGLQDMKDIVGYDDHFDVIEGSIDGNQEYLQEVANSIEKGVRARLVKRLTESQDVVLNKLQALVWIVTIIVLFLTMICVTTTMMAVVAERKKEIGLKKALGASNASVVKDFLGEAIMLGILGGVLGVGLGYLFADNVSISVFAREVSFPFLLVPFTLISSIILTVLACLLPVRTTVDIDPALVLRGE